MHIKTFTAVVKDAYFITPKVKHFVFELPQTSLFNYRPGQFISIHFEMGQKTYRRSYSIANPPRQNVIEIAAGYVADGPGTQYLFNLKPGDEVQMSGPYGRLVLKDERPKRMIYVATSTGITPMRAMLKDIEQWLLTSPEFKLVILQGVQTREDILYGDEWIALAQKYKNVECVFHLSRMQDNALKPYESHGYVQEAFSTLHLNPDEDYVYLCGNPCMIDQSFELLIAMGFKTTHIVREKYISN